MTYLLIFTPLFVIFILLLQNQKCYSNAIFLFVFMILLLGIRGIWFYPLAVPGFLPPVTLVFFYLIVFAFLLKYRFVRISSDSYRFYKIISIFIFLFLVASLRGFFEPGQELFNIRSFSVYHFSGLIFPIVLFLPDNKSTIIKYVKVLNISLLCLAVIYILIGFYNIQIEGGRTLLGGRVVWGGGQGIWVPIVILINYFSFRIMKTKTKFLAMGVIILGLVLIILSQTRNLVAFLVLPLLIVFTHRGIGTTIKKIGGISLFILTIYVTFISDYGHYGLNLDRFGTYEDVYIDDIDGIENLSYKNAPSKFKPLLWSIHETSDIFDFLIGHSFSFREYSGRKHFHSGIGWVYGSMGIVGVIILLILFLKVQNFYRQYINYKHGDLNSIIIEVILANFIVVAMISLVTGLLIQDFSLFWHGLSLAILEVARRNIINEQFIYRI